MIGGFKKFIRLVLVILILTGCSYAAENLRKTTMEPWIYQAMGFLQHNGLIAEYPSDWVNSGNQLSRFEIAYYIKGFIINQPASKDIPDNAVEVLQKLIAEFQMELTDLGIQITDIDKVSPNLAPINRQVSDYQDLDIIISKNKSAAQQPYYYLGQYFSQLQKKTFVFIPLELVQSNYDFLFTGNDAGFHVVYQPQLVNNPSFLVIKGYLPANDKKPLLGYYLFPIVESAPVSSLIESYADVSLNDSVLALLDEVNQIQWIDNLWSINGILPLNGYLPRENDLITKPLVGNLDQGLKIGGLLVYTENPSNKNSAAVSFGLPFYNSRMTGATNATTIPMDLDVIDGKIFQSIQFNILGSITLTPQTSLYGGVDILYRGANIGSDNIWPSSDAKASAGLNYHFNDYWTVLTYQSFVNSQIQTGWLSTTSVGIDYNDWVTLWLAYQLLNFDNPVISGAVELRF
jgi:hypothetical protein